MTDLPVHLALVIINGINVDTGENAYQELLACAQSWRNRYRDIPIGEVPGVQYARKFFHSIGVDPTKRRSSSEALLNRALKDKELYSVNSLVDVGNWCSLDFLLPICVYDLNKINGNVTIRLGKEGESYSGLNHNSINLAGRYCIADETGPFGSPITDSERTAVDLATKNAALVIFSPGEYDKNLLFEKTRLFADRVQQICGGVILMTDIIG
ncbi:MAG TPA: phenylalanine--tRNA ligase beta subunit-related protein [bacterium]|nr:phenylalanine--tRNA ligase beta subunit-related protein [bacterium]HPN46063.1 phenylalanine--tRNA ligase beta subunit-related protein [bacterium]